MSRRKRSIFKERRKINYKLIFALVILACVAVLLISYAISAIVSQKDELYDQGVKYYKSGSYQEAIDSFDNALAENQLFSKKKDQNIKLYLADAYLKSAQYTEAANTYNELIQDSFTGSNVKDLKELATALSDFSQGNYGGALDVLLKQAETYPELYMYIGTCYAVTDESDKMFESYEKYVQTFGFNSYVYAMYGSYYLNNGDMESAIAYITNGLDSGDKIYRKELLMLEITYYEKNEDYNKAYEIAGQLVSEYPDYEKGQKEYTFLSTRVSQSYLYWEELFYMEIQLWKEILSPYEQAVDELLVKFNHIIMQYKSMGKYSPIESVTGRVKTVSSIIDKLQKKNIPMDRIVEEMDDIAGIRIMCQFTEDISKVVEIIRGRQDMRIREEKDYIANAKASGYQSYHIILDYDVYTVNGCTTIQAEIQIRTMAMNFWATIEHSLQYKYRKGIPEDIRAKLKNAADATVALDREMSYVRGEIMDAQNSFNIKANIVSEIIVNIQNLYKVGNPREIQKIQDEFYSIYKKDDMELLENFAKQLDIIAEGYKAQSVR